jgi:hypothetical protein
VTKAHSTTVTVDSSTSYVEPGVTSPTFAALKSGLIAGVRGSIITPSTPTSPETVAAVIVFISPPNREPTSWIVRHHGHTPLSVTGTADNLGSDGFDLATTTGVIRIHVDANTLYFEAGVTAPNFQDVANGETVTVTGCSGTESDGQHPALEAYALYIGTSPVSPVTPATTSGAGAPPNTSGGELPPGGAISDVTSTSFLYTLGDHHVTVELESYTKFFLDGLTTTAASLTSPGVTAGTSGIVDPASTSGDYIVDANHVYLSTQPPAPTTTTTTTLVPGAGAPPNTSGGELPPGGAISDVTSTSFLYTLGDHNVTVELESYTKFFLDGVTTTAASLTSPGVTAGTSGIVDPASTSGDYIVDANHVYLTS